MRYLLVVFLTLSLLSVSAQEKAKQLIQENPARVANFLHVYESPSKVIDTPAPKGFKPFYVSHYGRHGSRFHTSGTAFDWAIHYLDTCDQNGLLTEEGKSILKELRALKAGSKDLFGCLSIRGAAEHRGISERLYERCPEMFKQADRTLVHAESTGVPRCNLSMANFCVQLKGNAPKLQFEMFEGGKFGKYLCNSAGTHSCNIDLSNRICDSVYKASFDTTRFLKVCFVDPDKAIKFFNFDPAFFMRGVLQAGAISECVSEEIPEAKNFFRHFSQDELYAYYANNTIYQYGADMAAMENDHSRYIIGIRILKDFLKKADAAVAGNNVVANLRFGHDTGIAPLMALLQIDGFKQIYSMRDVYKDNIILFKYVVMGANLQMIFYKNKEGQVLVKILRNEEEATIPALKSYSGPYYKWEDLRAYFLQRISLFPDNIN